MNKNVLGVVVVLAFLVGAGGVWWYFNPSHPKPQTGVEKVVERARGDTSNLIQVKCITEKIPGSVITMYIDDFKNQRTDTELNMGDKMAVGHMLYDGQYMYQWIEENGEVKMGTKTYSDFLNSENEKFDAAPKTLGRQENYIAINKAADINCEPWVVDESMFKLPAGVEFTEQFIPSLAPATQ